ncbi:MAG: hypothetical protein WC375_03250, partial [Methanomassiliicoccales archaeon]
MDVQLVWNAAIRIALNPYIGKKPSFLEIKGGFRILLYGESMTLKLYQQANRYVFALGEKDEFCSWKHYFLVPGIRSSYPHLWMALSDARNFLKTKAYHLNALQKIAREDLSGPEITDVSAEQQAVEHYMDILAIMVERAKASKKNQKIRDAVYKEMSNVTKELEKMISQLTEPKDQKKFKAIRRAFKKSITKFFPDKVKKEEADRARTPVAPLTPEMPPPPNGMPPPPDMTPSPPLTATASSLLASPIAHELRDAILHDYAEKACVAIQEFHRGFIYQVNMESNTIIIFSLDNSKKKPMLKIIVNEHAHVTDVIPMSDIARYYPYHSARFYQRYWKPISENIGHIYLSDWGLLVKCHVGTLPDMSSEENSFGSIEGWNVDKGRKETICVKFPGIGETWLLDKCPRTKQASVSRYTEQDYTQAIVR